MTRMTPRQALYYICLEMGPIAQTNRDDNITHREAKLRDAIRSLQNFIDYHDNELKIPDSANEYQHRELPPLTREDFIE
jgi:hypothetical protein